MDKKYVERFWSLVDVKGSDECWIWQGKPCTEGYGRMLVNGRSIRVHVLSWIIDRGVDDRPPSNLVVMHFCDTKLCVNPKHLLVGTHKTNNADAFARGLKKFGDNVNRCDADLHYVVVSSDCKHCLRVLGIANIPYSGVE